MTLHRFQHGTYEVGGPSSATPKAPHPVRHPLSIVAFRDALHHQELIPLHVRLDGVESIQTELRRSEWVIVRDVGWLGERDEIILDVLDVVDIEIVELRDRVDDYPQTTLQEARADIQDLWTRLSASESSKRCLITCVLIMDERISALEHRIPGAQGLTMLPKRMNRNAIERLIADRVATTIAEYEANWVNAARGAGPAEAGGARGARPAGNVAGGNVAPEVCGCSYKTFLNCNPHNFSRIEGSVGLSRWFEKLESVF
ncbi:hypothetical protein Tco_1511239 [Tanacetum coccineum]